jgi:universal stress protein F
MFKTILVPVDIDDVETSRPALDKAVALADAAGGTIRLIYVRSLIPVTFMEFVPPNFDTEQQAEDARRSHRARIAPPDHGDVSARLQRGDHRAARQMFGAGGPLGRFRRRGHRFAV